MAMKIKKAFIDKKVPLATDSYTNQIFVDLNQEQIKKLEKNVVFSVENFGIGNGTTSRFVTSWATKEEDIEKLIEYINEL